MQFDLETEVLVIGAGGCGLAAAVAAHDEGAQAMVVELLARESAPLVDWLVARFCPEIAGAEYFGARGSEGEAVLWGEKLGAAFSNIGAYQGYAAVAYPHGSLLSWTTIEKGGILVDESGRRFGNEGIGYSGYAREVLARKQKVFAVFDQRICDIAMHESEFREQYELGGFRRDFDAGVLHETLNSYDRAAGISGRDGARGYASGNGLLAAIGLGRIAGRQAAREIRQ